jgi:hypothetical protein
VASTAVVILDLMRPQLFSGKISAVCWPAHENYLARAFAAMPASDHFFVAASALLGGQYQTGATLRSERLTLAENRSTTVAAKNGQQTELQISVKRDGWRRCFNFGTLVPAATWSGHTIYPVNRDSLEKLLFLRR